MSDNYDGAPEGAPASERSEAEQRQWAFFAHLSAFAGLIVPFGNILGPLVIWQVKKEQMPFAAEHAKEALNFQITVTIAFALSFVLTFVLIGILLMPIVGIAAIVLTIMAAIKANNGESYRYPFTLRLIA